MRIKSILLVLMFMTASIYSEEKLFNINFDFGGIGIGATYEINETFNLDFMANVFELFIENKNSGIGVIYNPIKYIFSNYYDGHLLNLSNIKFFWNLYEFPLRLNKGTKDWILGPFFSLEFINLHNFNRINFMNIYSFGILFNIRYTAFEYFTNSFLNIELAYKEYNNKSSIYFGIKINYYTLVAVPLISIDYLINKNVQDY